MNVPYTPNLETIYLLPRAISIDPSYNVRPFSLTHTDAEDKRIEQLAAAMERCGQLDNILITPRHVLICGHRRRKAAMVINERRSARGESLFHLACNVDRSSADSWQKAIISNLHRKELSVMDLAYLITQIRAKFSWKGNEGYSKVAEYLGIERSAVYLAERFLGVPGQLQTMLHTGELSVQSALRLIRNVPERDQPRAIELAHQYQEEDQLDQALESAQKGSKSSEEVIRLIRQPEVKRIEAPAINRAVREITATRVPLTRVELISGLTRLEQPDLSPTHLGFLHYLLNTFIPGQGTIQELRTRFSLIGTSLGISTAESAHLHSPPN